MCRRTGGAHISSLGKVGHELPTRARCREQTFPITLSYERPEYGLVLFHGEKDGVLIPRTGVSYQSRVRTIERERGSQAMERSPPKNRQALFRSPSGFRWSVPCHYRAWIVNDIYTNVRVCRLPVHSDHRWMTTSTNGQGFEREGHNRWIEEGEFPACS